MNKVLLGAMSVSLLALAACNGTASVAPDVDVTIDATSSAAMMEASSAMMDDSSAMSADSSSSSSTEGVAMSAAATVEVIAQ